jgi:hypothetical protein
MSSADEDEEQQRNSHSLLVGMQNETVTLEDSLTPFLKLILTK